MERADFWYEKLRDLNPSCGEAPHKPLLLLAFFDVVERGVATTGTIALTGDLNERFRDYARIVQYHREPEIVAWLPFYHLRTQGFWETLDGSLRPTNDRRSTRYVRVDGDFLSFASSPEFRENARIILITEYFDRRDRDELFAVCGMAPPAPGTQQP
jgi:putative restriction endonuclease